MLTVNNFRNYNIKNQYIPFKGNNGYHYSSSSKTKKYATGFASLMVPGLGQLINGETSKGIAFFLGGLCNYLICFRKRNHMLFGGIARLAIGFLAAHDAYKHS